MSDGQGIQPAPQPTVWGFDHTQDGNFIVFIKQTCGGTSIDFVSTENATGIWQAIRDQTKQAMRVRARNAVNGSSDLFIPPKLILGPDGQALQVVPPSPDVVEMESRRQASADAAAEQAAVDEAMGREES